MMFAIYLIAILGLVMIAGCLIASHFYALGRKHGKPSSGIASFLEHVALDEEGLPQATRYPPGVVDECLRCRVPAECGVATSIGDPFTGRLLNGPICNECFRMQFQAPTEFWPLMRQRVQEEFRGPSND